MYFTADPSLYTTNCVSHIYVQTTNSQKSSVRSETNSIPKSLAIELKAIAQAPSHDRFWYHSPHGPGIKSGDPSSGP